MEKPLQKRRQTKQFQTGHEDDKKGLKNSTVKKDELPKKAEYKDNTHRIYTNSRDSSSTGTSYRETHVGFSHTEHLGNQPSHSTGKKDLKIGKEQERPHLTQSGRPTQSHCVERAPIVNTARDIHKVDTPLNAKLLSTRHVRLEENVGDGSHDNRAFEPDDSFRQIGHGDLLEATASQSQLLKCTPNGEFKDSISNSQISQRLDSMSPYKTKYSQGDDTIDHFSEMNEIARYKDINYGSCSFLVHTQNKVESVPTELFHHDDVVGAMKASQNGGTAEKIERCETADKMSVCGVYLQQPQTCGSNLNDVVVHPVPLSQKPTDGAHTLESSQALKTRKLPAITKRSSEGSAVTTRAHGRSNSLIPFVYPSNELRSATQSSRTVGRSQSMRIPSTSESAKPRRLLRELSLADADTTALRNYGALRGKNLLPRRQSSSASMKREATIQEEDSERPTISSEVRSRLLNLMQELLVRGKIKQVGVLDQETATLMLSLPAWNLRKADITGLVKAAGNTQEIMFKLGLDKLTYSCFKHDPNKIVGRADGKILVAQKTHTCVIVGLADHDTPGSCMYEVAELANALMEKDW